MISAVAHPITLAAGIATLNELTSERYSMLYETREEIRKGLTKAMSDSGIRTVASGVESLFDVNFTERAIVDYRSGHTTDKILRRCFDLGLLNRSIFLPPQHFGVHQR